MPCYHFTYHGYGTWMPDEEEGYVKRGMGRLAQDCQAASRYRGLMTEVEVEFSEDHQKAIIDEVHVAAGYQKFHVHFVALEPTHVHVLVSWVDEERRFENLRAGIRQSISRRMSREFGRREWLSEGGSRRRVGNEDHFNYLVAVYLPAHSGWKWSPERGLHK